MSIDRKELVKVEIFVGIHKEDREVISVRYPIETADREAWNIVRGGYAVPIIEHSAIARVVYHPPHAIRKVVVHGDVSEKRKKKVSR